MTHLSSLASVSRPTYPDRTVGRTIPAARVCESGDGVWRATAGSSVSAPVELRGVVDRFIQDVAADCGLVFGVDGDRADVSVELHPGGDLIPLAAGDRADGRRGGDADERYSLEISSTGATVRGATAEAVHRGLTTLRQLISASAVGEAAAVPAQTILDGPRFGWRGLSLDVSRTFHSAETVRRVIDMCSLYKLNVLHLHLTDDQGWRFEVPGWPLLTEVGAAGALGDREGGHYTPADVADLVSYAAERFVTVVPEVDLPGHTAAVFAAYPELAPEPAPQSELAQAQGIAIGTLDLERGRTRELVRDALAAAAQQFHTSAVLHVGGDEAFGMAPEDHAAFVDFTLATVRGLGRRAIGWQEAARGHVGAEEIIQYWIEPNQLNAMFEGGGPTEALPLPAEILELVAANLRVSFGDVPAALAKDARILVSSNRTLYLDRPHADEAPTEFQEAQRARVGLRAYPAATLRELVEWDPVDETPGIEDDSRLAGVEAAIWCETVTNRDDLEFLLLPRLAGVGERAWSSAPTEWDEYVTRLGPASRVWSSRGWNWFRAASVDWPAESC